MKPEYIIVHHSGGTDAQPLADSSNYTVALCDRDHKARGFGRSSLGYHVGYTYFIDKAGVVTQTRKDTEEGAHTVGKNRTSIGICLAGNFDAFMPTEAQVTALRDLLKRKMLEHGIPAEKIVPHRTFAVKSCYGRKLADDWARKLVAEKNPLESYKTVELINELRRRIVESDL